MNHQQYDQWLAERLERATKAVEPSSMIGLAGEIGVLAIPQLDINDIATQQIQMLEEERRTIAHESTIEDFTERQSDFQRKLNTAQIQD